MKAALSRYRPLYLTSLVYMLQATEYNLRDYLAWHERTVDFSRVAKRKQLVLTAKSRLLILLLWLLSLSVIGLLAAYLSFVINVFFIEFPGAVVGREAVILLSSSIAIVAVCLLLTPWLIAYSITIPLWLGSLLLQKPLEYLMIKRAQARVKSHPGIKIAIAGSFGKTTIKEMIAVVLRQAKTVAATVGNQNTPIGISRFVKQLGGDENVLIFEFGEYKPGDVRQFCQLTQPQLGIITGINEAHLRQFKSLKTSVKNIFTLARYLKSQPVFVNAENTLSNRYGHPGHLLYSRKGVDGWVVTQAKTGLAGTSFVAKKGKKIVKAKSGLLGLHQIGPLCVAIAIADRVGLSAAQIQRRIAQTVPFEHRLQPQSRGDIVVIDDTYNGNPDGVAAALEFLKSLKGHRKVYVTPGLVEMGRRTEPVHQQIGQQLAKVVDVVVLIRNSVTPFIEQGLEKQKFKGELLWFDDALTCYNSIGSYTKPGDVVLLQNDWPDQYI